MVKRDVHDTISRDTDPRNTGSRNTGPQRDTDSLDGDLHDTETMTVSKPLGSATMVNNFIDPHFNGRWVFSNQGYNNRVADLQFGQYDRPFIGYQLGGGDNQRFFFTQNAGTYKISVKASAWDHKPATYANIENNQIWGRLSRASDFKFFSYGNANLNEYVIATKESCIGCGPLIVWTLTSDRMETWITLEPFQTKRSQVWWIHPL